MAKAKTQAERDAIKAASSARNRAFNARYKAYNTAKDEAEAKVQSGPLAVAAEQANTALDQALAARNAEEADLKAQIDALTRKLQETREAHGRIIEPLSVQRRQAYSTLHDAVREAADAVRADFADVADCYSPAAWKPYEEFLESK